jgi:dihydroflavonol-4-reductase
MIALVTGSTGFIGAYLCRTLCEQGIQVRAFHRPSSNTLLLDGLPVEHVIGDITQPETYTNSLKGIDVLFHTAAVLNSREGAEKLTAINVSSTRSLLQTALKQGVKRVIYTSSVAALGVPEQALGHSAPPTPLDETHTWNFIPGHWQYGYSKYLAEMEVQYAVSQGLDAVIVNPSIVMGAGNINRLTNSPVVLVANRRLPVTVPAGMNIVHIDDVAQGHLAAWQKGKTGERYILGAHNIDLAVLLKEIARLTGGRAPKISIPVPLARNLVGIVKTMQKVIPFPLDTNLLYLAGYYFYYNTEKARCDLGLPASLPLKSAIMDSYRWFQKMGTVRS